MMLGAIYGGAVRGVLPFFLPSATGGPWQRQLVAEVLGSQGSQDILATVEYYRRRRAAR